MNNKAVPSALKFVNMKGIVALKEGILFTLPLLMVGSIFLLISSFPYQPVVDLINNLGWMEAFNQVSGATFNISAIVAVVGIAYSYAKNENVEPLSAGFLGFVCFLITLRSNVESESGDIVSNIINKTWTAGQGMIGAIIIGLIVGYVYSLFINKGITIKMPDSVPSNVSSSFAALVPGAVLIAGSAIIFQIFNSFDITFIEFIYKAIQAPMQGVTDSLFGIILYCTIATIFWWFGVHGGSIVTGIMGPLLLSNLTANQAIVDSGQALTVSNGAYIVTDQFTAIFINLTGTGTTLGLVIFMAFLAKSKQLKELGKLSFIPSIFNINEPVIFGTPIVMNPFLFIPFVLTPTVVGILMYGSIYFGLVPPFSGVTVPWTTPAIISGFLLGGWRMALAQVVILGISCVMYFPFIRKVDKMNLIAEAEAE
ncbi:PTS transporter subunit EIIC [Vagococcus fluvialis]|uniref:PTS sugar transporter subunit IIC n=1 Tax=Vagococcus fluvialis TaxID=2738 RepID=UPI002890E040|nr:PTS transporter subunit EIIC [Vagococcus fluvialis]MDT2781600.1 PTS transporter subunit EIIC [Vagococcus fluvialis]